MTRTSHTITAMIASLFLVACGSSAADPDYGSLCQSGNDCGSGLCVAKGAFSMCSQSCETMGCPMGDQCIKAGSSWVCNPGTSGGGSGNNNGQGADAGAGKAPDAKPNPVTTPPPPKKKARGKFCNDLSKSGSDFYMALYIGSGSSQVKLRAYSGYCSPCTDLPVGSDIAYELYDDDTNTKFVGGTFDKFSDGEQMLFITDISSSGYPTVSGYTLKPGYNCESVDPFE